MAQIAADAGGGPVTANRIARHQDIPLQSLLNDLKRARLVRSKRGRDGGFELWRPAKEITVGDVYRALEGPLISVGDVRFSEFSYTGPAAPIADVWMAARSSLRKVLDNVTIDDLADGRLPQEITELASEYRNSVRRPGGQN